MKLARGGLLDCEFAAQFLVLSGLGRVAGETTLETLQRASETGSMATADGERLVLSASLQSALLQIARVADPQGFSPEEAPQALKELMVEAADDVLKELGVGEQRNGVGSFGELGSAIG